MPTLETLVGRITDLIVNPLIALLFAVALAYFLWGVGKFILNADNPGERKTGINHIIYGLIGMAIMVSVFGILQIFGNTFGFDVPSDGGSGYTIPPRGR